MLRRQVFGGAAALALGAGLSRPGAAASPKPLISAQTYVCNLGQNCSPQRLQTLTPATVLTLKPEPERSFDPGSIAVYSNGERLGYLPRHESRTIKRLMEAGLAVSASVVRVQQTPRPKLDIALTIKTGAT
jgi:hypothetical protein